MNKITLLLLSLFTASVFAGEPIQLPQHHLAGPTVKVLMSRTKKRQMNIYYASQANEVNDNAPDTDADDLDIHVGYRRPELAYDAAAPDADTIPEHILKRLETARRRAVNRHRELWT